MIEWTASGATRIASSRLDTKRARGSGSRSFPLDTPMQISQALAVQMQFVFGRRK
jgi:hypothetical protein